jgi:hypothetical protein
MLPDGAVTFSDGPEVFLVSNSANRDLYVFSNRGWLIGGIYPGGQANVWVFEPRSIGSDLTRVKYRVEGARSFNLYSDYTSDVSAEPVMIRRNLSRSRFYEIRGTRLIKSGEVRSSFPGDLVREDRRPGKFFAVDEMVLERRRDVEVVVDERGEYVDISSHRGDDDLFDSCRAEMILRLKDHRVLPGFDPENVHAEEAVCFAAAPRRLWHGPRPRPH